MKKTIAICFLVVAFAMLGTAVGSTDLAVRSSAVHFANGGNPPACLTTGSATLATSPTSAVSEAATEVADSVAPPPPDNSGALVADGVVPPPPDPSPSGSLTGIAVPTSSSGLLLADGVVPPPPDPPSAVC